MIILSQHILFFKFIPNYNIDYLIVKACRKYNKYQLFEGKKETLRNLESGKKYYIFIETKNERGIKVTLTTDFYSSYPFEDFSIYELKTFFDGFDSSYKENIQVTNNINNSHIIISFNYKINNSGIEYVALEITPYIDITYLESSLQYITSLSTIIVILIFVCLFVVIIIIIIIIYKRCKHSKNSNIETLIFQPLYKTDGALNNQQQNNSSSQKNYMPQNQLYSANQPAYYQPQQLKNSPDNNNN